jgi:hypothetical protein
VGGVGPLDLAAQVPTARDCGTELDVIRAVQEALAAGRGVGVAPCWPAWSTARVTECWGRTG